MMDQLTGLAGRNEFLRWLERAGRTVSGIYLDIDGFNGVTYTFGHLEGDRILTELGSWLAQRASSLGLEPFRVGGDEFLLTGNALTGDRAWEIANDLVRESQTLGFPYAHPLKTRTVFSLSAVIFPAKSADHGQLRESLDQLDTSLYLSKQATGRDFGVVASAETVEFPQSSD